MMILIILTDIASYSNAVRPFIYPIYGYGELPQAFCRCAAVKGALYVSDLFFYTPAFHYYDLRASLWSDCHMDVVVHLQS